jgi:hypothetical protein
VTFALGTTGELRHIRLMKVNSPGSIKAAAIVFRSYGGSWTAARAAGLRDEEGRIVISVNPARGDTDGRFVAEVNVAALTDARATGL